MRKAKRAVPAIARLERGEGRSRPARRGASGVGVGASVAIEGRVVSAREPGRVRAELSGGQAVEALCPAHVDHRWLREACERGPVAAVFVTVRPSGRHVLWGIFPGTEHADVKSDVVIRGREVTVDADSLHLSSRNAHLTLEPDGNVALKGRDVTSHARRVNRIKGGSIRLN